MAIHDIYNKLTPDERDVVDLTISHAFDDAKRRNIKLFGDDRCEVVAEALAVWIIQSRDR